jgi:predicted  nucleic acid-binding Zn-ribbon protein
MCNVLLMCLCLSHVYSERDRFRTKDDTFQKQLQTLRSDIERLSRIVDTVETLIKQDWPKKYVLIKPLFFYTIIQHL